MSEISAIYDVRCIDCGDPVATHDTRIQRCTDCQNKADGEYPEQDEFFLTCEICKYEEATQQIDDCNVCEVCYERAVEAGGRGAINTKSPIPQIVFLYIKTPIRCVQCGKNTDYAKCVHCGEYNAV